MIGCGSKETGCIVCEETQVDESIFCEEHQFLEEHLSIKNTEKLIDEVKKEKNLWNTDNSEGFYQGCTNTNEVLSDDGLIATARVEAFGEDYCLVEKQKYTSANMGPISFIDTFYYKDVEVFKLIDNTDEKGHLAVPPAKGTKGLFAKEYGELAVVYLETGSSEYFNYLSFVYNGECLDTRYITK